MLCALAGQAQANIFTCVDAKGRRITSDRPIPECNDRVQKQLNPSGTVKGQIGPSLTAAERAAKEEKARKEAEERGRQGDDKKRDRALLSRYPDRASHDKERAAALVPMDEAIKSANARLADLAAQRTRLDAEIDFYKRNPARLPPALRRQLDDNEQAVATQKRFIATQEDEKKRVHLKFDDELDSLRRIWAMQQRTPIGQ